MTNVAIVQARMSSVRLPGKVLRELEGKPMLAWTLDRLHVSQRVDEVVVATSTDATDDAIERFCVEYGARCFRGALLDVADRFGAVIREMKIHQFVRISGDSPLIDPAVVDAAIGLYEKSVVDLVTNVQNRTFPKGQSVEVVRVPTFRRVCALLDSPLDKEHVTRYFYRCQGQYRMINFEAPFYAAEQNLSVDTLADFECVSRLIKISNGSPGTWQDLISIKTA